MQIYISAINFAEQHAEISKKDKAIIFHARKSLLFNGQHVWIKKKGGKPLVIFFFINFQKNIAKKILVYTRTMD